MTLIVDQIEAATGASTAPSGTNPFLTEDHLVSSGVHGVTGSIVGTSDTQTLTAKTIVVASNTITTAASGNLTSTELNAALAELQTDIDTRIKQGKHTIWVPARAMTPATTSGAASGTVETTTNAVIFETLDFDGTADEYAQFQVKMPKSWNEGTITFVPVWSHDSTATNFGVSWWVQGVSFTDDDAGDAAFGTAQESEDTGGTTDDIYHGPESSAITIAGTPAAGDLVVFRVYRDVSDAGDTMAIDARLHGIALFYTVNAGDDT